MFSQCQPSGFVGTKDVDERSDSRETGNDTVKSELCGGAAVMRCRTLHDRAIALEHHTNG